MARKYYAEGFFALLKQIQKLKVKNKNDKSKLKFLNLCSVILLFHFYILHFGGVYLEIGFWNLANGIATLRSQ